MLLHEYSIVITTLLHDQSFFDLNYTPVKFRVGLGTYGFIVVSSSYNSKHSVDTLEIRLQL